MLHKEKYEVKSSCTKSAQGPQLMHGILLIWHWALYRRALLNIKVIYNSKLRQAECDSKAQYEVLVLLAGSTSQVVPAGRFTAQVVLAGGTKALMVLTCGSISRISLHVDQRLLKLPRCLNCIPDDTPHLLHVDTDNTTILDPDRYHVTVCIRYISKISC